MLLATLRGLQSKSVSQTPSRPPNSCAETRVMGHTELKVWTPPPSRQ